MTKELPAVEHDVIPDGMTSASVVEILVSYPLGIVDSKNSAELASVECVQFDACGVCDAPGAGVVE